MTVKQTFLKNMKRGGLAAAGVIGIAGMASQYSAYFQTPDEDAEVIPPFARVAIFDSRWNATYVVQKHTSDSRVEILYADADDSRPHYYRYVTKFPARLAELANGNASLASSFAVAGQITAMPKAVYLNQASASVETNFGNAAAKRMSFTDKTILTPDSFARQTSQLNILLQDAQANGLANLPSLATLPISHVDRQTADRNRHAGIAFTAAAGFFGLWTLAQAGMAGVNSARRRKDEQNLSGPSIA